MDKIKKCILLVVGLSCIWKLSQSILFVHATTGFYYQNEKKAYDEALKELEDRVGTYPVTLYFYNELGEKETKAIAIQLVGDHTVSNQKIAIDARDVTVYEDEIVSFTDSDWLEACRVFAWQLENGEEITAIHIDKSRMKPKAGKYTLVFSLSDQISKAVNVQVLPKEARGTSEQFEKNVSIAERGQETVKDNLSWQDFVNNGLNLLKWLFIPMTLIPLVLFLMEYLFTRNLVKQVIDLIVK